MPEIVALSTGVPNLDAVLGGGIPVYSLNLLAGPPGTGKTILAQQIIFNHIRQQTTAKALYLTTLSEPMLKVVRYMQHFTFFDAEVFGERVVYYDIGHLLRRSNLSEVLEHLMRLVEEHLPELLVVDSFKALHDLSGDTVALRRFCYDLSIRLASARCTSFLVGEYDRSDLARNAEFAIADGILYLEAFHQEDEQQRLLHVYKMRGQAVNPTSFPFIIATDGLRILNPIPSLGSLEASREGQAALLTTGILGLDKLLHGGIPMGSSVLLSGVSGTGKTTMALQFLVHGAAQGEASLLFAFEESPGLLRRTAEAFGWDLPALETQGRLRIVYIPQTDIRVDELLDQVAQEVNRFQPRRIVVDSFSVFLYKMRDAAMQRERAAQLVALVQQGGGVGLFLSDIPSAEPYRLSRFGVEETVVDGTILLFTERVDFRRRRYLEVAKMRGIDHVPGHHRMDITAHGMEVYYEAPSMTPRDSERPLLFSAVQHTITVPFTFGTSWLVLGESAAGKSFLATQFAAEGLQHGESVLYIALEEPQSQVRRRFEAFGAKLSAAQEAGRFSLLTPPPDGLLDLEDDRQRLYHYLTCLRDLIPPVRIVVDSITSVALRAGQALFPIIEERMIRALTNQDTSFFLTIHRDPLSLEDRSTLISLFDVTLDLYTPDWGEMRLTGEIGRRVLQVRKARAVAANPRPYPYTISATAGLVIETDYYRRHMAQGI